MLNEIKFLDHIVQSCEYSEGAFIAEKGGSLHFTVERAEQFTNEKGEENKEYFYFEDICVLEIKGENETEESDNKLAFCLKAKVQLIYEVPSRYLDDVAKQSFSDENKWYFENMAHLVCHQVASIIMSTTAFDKVMDVIPRYPNN
jgi:hypothetical protein